MIKEFFGISKEAASEFVADDAMTLAAALALYTVIALAPLIAVVLTIAGLVMGETAAQGFVQQAERLVGGSGGEAIRGIVDNVDKPAAGTLQTIFSFAVLLFSASVVFAQLQASLNRVWNVVQKPGLGIWFMVKTRLFSMAVVVTLGFLLMVSLIVSTSLAAFGNYLQGLVGGMEPVLHVLNFIIAVGVTTLLFAGLYKYVPDVIVTWREVWVGALVTAVLFNLGQIGIGIYLGSTDTASAYGAAGSFIVLILWLYYSTVILFYGAEWAQVRARLGGNRFEPAPHAMRLVVESRDADDTEAEAKIADKSASDRLKGRS